MAGDWIKIQHVTPDKPEIYQIASALGVTPEDAFGRCVRIWIWADQQSLNGHEISVTFVTLDSLSRHAGFGIALAKVGWLIDNGDGTVTFPRFDRHNGETAKTRADATNRKRRQRENQEKVVTDMSQKDRDESVTREEKRCTPSSSLRSEDGEAPKKPVEKKNTVTGSRIPADWFLPKDWGEWALKERLDLSPDDVRREADNFRDHWLSQAGARGRKANWLATWRKWIRSDLVKPSSKGGNSAKSGLWFMSSSGIEAKAAELGIAKSDGEFFPNFKARVYHAAGVTDEMVRRAKIDAGERV